MISDHNYKTVKLITSETGIVFHHKEKGWCLAYEDRTQEGKLINYITKVKKINDEAEIEKIIK